MNYRQNDNFASPWLSGECTFHVDFCRSCRWFFNIKVIALTFFLRMFPWVSQMARKGNYYWETDWSVSSVLRVAADPVSTQGSDSPCINCTAIIPGSPSFLFMSPVWLPLDLHSWLIEMALGISFLMCFIISRPAFCLQLLEVFSASAWDTFMSCLQLGTGASCIVCGRNFICKSEVLWASVVRLQEATFSSSLCLSPAATRCLGSRGSGWVRGILLSQASARALEAKQEAWDCLLLRSANYLHQAHYECLSFPCVSPHAGLCHRDRDIWSLETSDVRCPYERKKLT